MADNNIYLVKNFPLWKNANANTILCRRLKLRPAKVMIIIVWLRRLIWPKPARKIPITLKDWKKY